ncbi:MAG: tRNA (adenine-N1)-methyltransferase [Nitrososphaerota archaeon]|nr:tRNA (adenine-N1)-methyltransferase [Nitrososphaerota archaeon]
MERIGEHEYVLVMSERGKSWLIKAEKDKKFQTHISTIDMNDILGAAYGSHIYSGGHYVLLRPTLEDLIMRYKRGTQIVYSKDAGYILIRLDLRDGKKVLEMGTGSGAMSSYLASAVSSSGRVLSYEIRDDFMPIAKRNLEMSGLLRYVELRDIKVQPVPDDESYDSAFVDLGDPWEHVGEVYRAVRPSAPVSFLIPTINQAERLSTALTLGGFGMMDTVEIMIRKMNIAEGKSRPSVFMSGHTAYLMFAKKLV